MHNVLITGGTGLVGTALTKMLLSRQYSVTILTRNIADVKHRQPGVNYAAWDVKKQAIDPQAIGQADYIIHLAGAGVADKRWSEARKQEIVKSRTESSALVVKALSEQENHVKAVVSASAIGWYGPDTEASRQYGFVETQRADTAFLGETCRLWEESIEPVQALGKRLVKLRTGIVLSPRGGALEEFKKPLKAFVAAVLGDGSQVVSWIHINDLCRMYITAIENETMRGAFNAVSPQPVTNRELTLTLAREMRGGSFVTLRVPSFALKIALGEMSIEVLKSATVSSSKIQSTGFHFEFPGINAALKDCLGK